MLRSIKFLVPFIAVFLFLLGCEETEPIDEETDDVILMVDSAITALEDELFALSTAEVNHPSDIDFSTPNALFKAALALDPGNLDANFGAGLTGILLFTKDADVQAVFDAWEAFLDTGSAFVADTAVGSPGLSLGFLLPGASRQSPIQAVDEKEVAYSYLNLFNLVVSNPPTIGDIQDVIESAFLPELDYALERFDVVDDSPTFSFIITPKMQGDTQEDSVEFDLTELYMLETAVNLLRSFFSVTVAYNVGPDAYDSTAIIDLLSQGDGFLSLRTNGAAQMGAAKQSLLNASYALDNAIDFLRAETDDQSDDIITITAGELEEADLDSMTNHNADFRDYLENGLTLTEDWNDDGQDTDLTFNFSNLFENPIQDFKSLLPDYSVSVGRDTAYEYGDWQDFTIRAYDTLTIQTAGEYNYQYNRNYWWDMWDDREDSSVYVTEDIPEFTRIVDSLLAVFRAADSLSNWNIGINWYIGNYFDPGEYPIWADIWYGYEPRYPAWVYYTGILSWDAETFDEWVFPNPTLNGFLPDIADDADFKATFGITEADFLEMKDEPLIIHFEFFSGGIHKMIPGPLVRSGMIPWANRD